jgi:dTDP-4-dehydrorhamnose 3,5-epimerase
MADVVESTEIPGVWLIRPEVHTDERGRFLETYRSSWLPFAAPMVQANRSDSAAKVLRGLHYHRRQADLWFVQRGKVTTVLVDTRIGSPTEGKHTTLQQGGGEELAVYIPEGVAHGFYAHDEVTMTYLVTGEYDGTDELGIAWNDPDLAISWPDEQPILSGRDKENPRLADVPADRRVPYTG